MSVAAPIVILALAAPLVFLVRKWLRLAVPLTLGAILAAIGTVALTAPDATGELLGIPLRLSPLARLSALVLLAVLAALVLAVWLEEPAYNFFPTALGTGAAVVSALILSTPLAAYVALVIALLLPVGSFTFQVHRNRSVAAASRHFAFVTLGGTLGLAALAIAAGLPRDQPQDTFVLLVVVIYVAFALKLSAIPFHTHAALLASEAPTGALGLLFGVLMPTTVIAFAGIITASGFLPSIVQLVKVQTLLLWIGAASAVGGGLLATGASDLRRLVVYSVISGLGIALVGIGTFSGPGIVGGIAVALVTGAAAAQQLLAAGTLERRAAGGHISAARAPLAAAAFVGGAIALIGAPPLVGFPGRFYVEFIAYAVSPWLGGALVLATLLVLLAQLRMAMTLFADGLPSWRPEPRPVTGLIGIAIFAALLAGGIAPDAFLAPIAAFAEEFLRTLRPL